MNPIPAPAPEVDETAFSQEVSGLLAQLPAQLRTFITGSERDVVIAEIKSGHGLEGKAASIFERDLLLLLLGVLTPDEFQGSLIEAGISTEKTDSILKQVDAKIFSRFTETKPKEEPVHEALPNTLHSTQVSRPVPPAPNTTPLVKEYVADPYREPIE